MFPINREKRKPTHKESFCLYENSENYGKAGQGNITLYMPYAQQRTYPK